MNTSERTVLTDTHVTIDPAILYFGTPVALIGTVSATGRPNLTPMSSVFWLGHTAVLGLGASTQAALNLHETGDCVINLPSSAQVDAVDRLALTTGRDPVPVRKAETGYRHESDKFGRAGLTPVDSTTVTSFRVRECPVQLEAQLVSQHGLGPQGSDGTQRLVAFEVSVTAVHIHPELRLEGHRNRVDPDKWRPLIMSFQKFYGLTEQVHPSTLSTIDEEWYRGVGKG